MSHRQQLDFLRCVKSQLLLNGPTRVLEIGAHDVNGSIRNIFNASIHVGVDLSSGKNVDHVASGHEIDLKDSCFNICISSECFEHNPFWIRTLSNMIDHLPGGGVLIITAATNGRPEHGTARTDPSISPGTSAVGWNYYKNVGRGELEREIRNHPKVANYFLAVQKFTFDIYLVANITASVGRAENFIDLGALAREYRNIKFSPINATEFLYQIWLFPMRVMKLILPENACINLFVHYEKTTKSKISRLVRRIRNFSKRPN